MLRKLYITIATSLLAGVGFAAVGDIIALGPNDEFRVDSSGNVIATITETVSGGGTAGAQFGGTTTAKKLFFNLEVDDGDITATCTNTISAGTATVTYRNLGDY